MALTFWKMNGAGNDFVCLDNRKGSLRLNRKRIAALCHRQFGVGADGLLVLENSKNGADYRMRYYNADGGEAEMCGNGARCFARFAQKMTKNKKKRVLLQTGAGPVGAEYFGGEVRVELTPPTGLRLAQEIKTSRGVLQVHSVNTGVPHAVLFVEDVENFEVFPLGRELRYHKAFAPKGTNVNFVQPLSSRRLRVRTYERGVEGETLACGTGVTAAGLIAHKVLGLASPIEVQVQGGDVLKVYFEPQETGFAGVKLHGPADFVFEGEIDV